MSEAKILKVFKELGVLQNGHFQLTSGLHSQEYVQCAKLFEYPRQAGEVLESFLPWLPQGTETIIAPAIGGITVGYELARLWDRRFLFAERREGRMTFRRGFELKPGEKVLVAEDVITTGGSVQEVIDLAKASQAEILGVAVLVDRSCRQVDFGVSLSSLLKLDMKVYRPEECPLCARNLPLNQPGSRN